MRDASKRLSSKMKQYGINDHKQEATTRSRRLGLFISDRLMNLVPDWKLLYRGVFQVPFCNHKLYLEERQLSYVERYIYSSTSDFLLRCTR
jgi:hypothetical protein